MIVCHITSTLGTGVGNTVTRLISGVKMLYPKVYLIYLPCREDMKCDRYNLTAKKLSDHNLYVERKDIFDKTYSLKIAPLILRLRNKVDLFHCHITTFGMSNILRAFIMGTLSRMIRKPFLLSFYIFPESSLSRCAHPVIHFLLKLLTLPVNEVMTPSHFSKKRLLEIGINAQKIVVIHPAINTEVYKPMADTFFRSKLNISDKDFLILYLGALRPDKGIEYLIEAFHELISGMSENGKDLFLAIVGGNKSIYVKKIMKSIDRVSAGNVKLLLEHIKDVPSVLSSSDVVVLPLINCDATVSIPIVLLESLATGRPVIASNVGGASEVVKDGVNGFLVRPCCAEEITTALLKLKNDSSLREGMGKNGRQIILEQFSLPVVSMKLSQEYKKSKGRK